MSVFAECGNSNTPHHTFRVVLFIYGTLLYLFFQLILFKMLTALLIGVLLLLSGG